MKSKKKNLSIKHVLFQTEKSKKREQNPNGILFSYTFFGFVIQGSVGHQKTYGSGNLNPFHKHPSSRHQRSGSKRNPNGPAPFPVPLPYHQVQPAIPPVMHTMVPPPHMAVPGYAYQPFPGPVPTVETPLAKSGSETPVQAFVPPAQPPPRGDPNVYPVNFSSRRPNTQEAASHWNHNWHHQRPFSPRDSIPMQQGVGPRPFIRPQFFAPPPGFMVGPSFPGNYTIC